MARPAKSIATKTGQISNAEKKKREEIEGVLKGKNDLTPPRYLTKNQKKIFNFILGQLEESKLLGRLDGFILERASVSIDRLQLMDRQAAEQPEMLFNNQFRLAQAQASQEFFRCCNELCLSPQARAKLSISAAKSNEPKKKTLMDLINDEDEE